jgi:hypothetical protein
VNSQENLRSKILQYYELYQKKDEAGMKDLWSARSPGRERISVTAEVEYSFSNITISHITVDRDLSPQPRGIINRRWIVTQKA